MGFFSKEEESRVFGQFWQDGVTRRVTIRKDMRPGKTDPNKMLCYIEVKEEGKDNGFSFLDFNFLNALRPLEGVVEGVTILAVTPAKVGERVYNGKTYDVLEYAISLTGDSVAPATTEEVAF